MKRYSKALGSVLGLAVLPLLLSCSDPTGLEEGPDDKEPKEFHQKPMSVRIHGSAADIEVGQTIRLRAILYAPDGKVLDGDLQVNWATSRPDRVLITDEGYATGVAPGNSRIMAESEFGSDWTYVKVQRRAPGRDPEDGDKDRREFQENGDQDKRR
jgi:hypothetical protein